MLPENTSVMNSVECIYNKILIEVGCVVINMFVRNFTFVKDKLIILKKMIVAFCFCFDTDSHQYLENRLAFL